MEYQRIDKPSHHHQTGGFSPGKLRTMLLGMEKRRKEEEELEPRFSLRSEAAEIDTGGSGSDGCRDVDVVTSPPECSTSTDTASGGRRLSDHTSVVSKVGPREEEEEESNDSESVFSLAFEFQKPERAVHRPALVPPFLKPPPSKWDDAEKWIASPTSNRQGKAGGPQPKKPGLVGHHRGRNPATKVVLEVTDGVEAKRMDPVMAKREMGGQKAVGWVPDPPVVDLGAKPALIVENSVTDSTVSLSRHDSSQTVHCATTFVTPPSTVKSVSMRDMGTEMTPAASEEPSRTGSPLRPTTPTRSPTSSRPSTPGRTAPSSTIIDSADSHGDSSKNVLSQKELQMEVRREIMLLGTKLGKANIAAWASKEQEETDASTSPKTVPVDQPTKSVIEARAAAWEEAEKAKYLARYKQEEIKIQAWEHHQKAKTEAGMRKVEVEVERMRARAHDRLMNKLASARHKAEEKRAAAEAKRNRQADTTAQQAEYIRRTGSIPSSISCFSCCS